MSGTSRVNWNPPLTRKEELELDTFKTWEDVPATSYLSVPGKDYYGLTPEDLPQPAPYLEKVSLRIELRALSSPQNTADDPEVFGALRAMRYTSNKGVTGIFKRVGPADGFRFLNGRLLLFSFFYNPDKGEEGIAVHRAVALGVRRQRFPPGKPHLQWGELVFLREIDTYGRGLPEISATEDDFQLWSSPARYPDPELYADGNQRPHLFKDLILEAGSIADLG